MLLACDVLSACACTFYPMASFLRFFVFTLPDVLKGWRDRKIMRKKFSHSDGHHGEYNSGSQNKNEEPI